MPVVTIADKITRPEDLVEFFAQYLEKANHENKFSQKVQYIAKYDEVLIPKYPALHIQAASIDKALHSTETFLVAMRAAIHVLHANMAINRQTRNYEDLVLTTSVVDFLESDMRLGGKIIQGWVESETPGVLPPRVTKGEAIVSTRLNWIGTQQRRFK